jgi:hypothetical protein
MSLPIELYYHLAEQSDNATRLTLNQVSRDFRIATATCLSTRIEVGNMAKQNVVRAILAPISFRAISELLESQSVYCGDTLREIYLRCAQEGNYTISIPTLAPMPFLTTLDLQGDAFSVPRSQRWSIEGASVEEICKSATNLEQLKLASVNHASDAMLFISSLSKLRSLSLTMGPEQSFRSRRDGIKVECPKLEQLQIANYHEEYIPVLVTGQVKVEARGHVRVSLK